MPAEYTYQMYMGFGLHPHLTPDPPLRKQIFFERGGMGFGAHLRTFCRFAVDPSGPRPRPPVSRPGTRSSNEQRPNPARPRSPRPAPPHGEREGQRRPNPPPCLSIV